MEKYRIPLLMVTPETSSRVPSGSTVWVLLSQISTIRTPDSSINVSAELALDTENSFLDEIELSYSSDEAVITRETYVTSNGLSVLPAF